MRVKHQNLLLMSHGQESQSLEEKFVRD